MRKYLISLLIGLMLLTATPFAYAADTIRLIVNGKDIYSDVPPQIINGRTMIPARALAESLGAKVAWDDVNSSVTVTKPEVTKIVEPKPINTTGQVQIIGPSDFKSDVEQALALLKEKSPEDYKLVINYTTQIENNTSGAMGRLNVIVLGGMFINYNSFNQYTSKLNSNDKVICMAGVIVHENYHIYMHEKGIVAYPKMFAGQEDKSGISQLENEILAFSKERRLYNKLGAPTYIINSASLDKISDTNYNNKIPLSFQ